eukprot:1287480-Pleurochrysis_carterae.AAC.1
MLHLHPSLGADPLSSDYQLAPERSFAQWPLVHAFHLAQVTLVTEKSTQQMYAMKVLRKDLLLFHGKQSVLQAVTEKQVLQEMSAEPHPFIVSLLYAFQVLCAERSGDNQYNHSFS